MDLYDVSVGSYMQILQGFTGVLDKGAAFCGEQGVGLDDALRLGLADDMFDFHQQVLCVAHHSRGAIDGIKSGAFSPPDLTQDLDYAGLQNLIGDTLASLQGESADDINGLAGGKVIFTLGGNEIPFTTENFIVSFSLPNFYFHAATAYDILRAQGCPLGKRDFLGGLRIGA